MTKVIDSGVQQGREGETDFRKVMDYVTERAVAEHREEDVMAALFDVVNGPIPIDG